MRPFAFRSSIGARPAAAILLFLSAMPVLAQRNPTETISQGTAYNVYAQPGEATIEILVLGDAASGIYVVGDGTNLSELLALVGGSGGEGTSADVEVKKTIRLLREQGAQRVVVYEARLEDLLREPGAYPALQNGDVFTIDTETRRTFSLRDTLSIVSSIGTLTLLVLRLIDVSSN